MINFQTNLRVYGKRVKVERKYIAYTLIVIALVTPMTNWLIPVIYKKRNGEWYI